MLRFSARKLATAVGIVGLMAGSGAVNADPINYLPAGSELRIKFTNYEKEITGLGQELFGLINITQILSGDGLTPYWTGVSTDNTRLVGYFEGLTSIADQTGGTGLSFTGGKVVLYNVPVNYFVPTTNPNTKDYDNQICGGNCALLTPWLTLDFVAGINDSLGALANATLQSAFATTIVQTGNGFLDVSGGANSSFFQKDTFTFTNFDPADASLRSNFALQGANCSAATAANWAVCSDDPINIKTRAVPEPGTVALLGIAAFAAGMAGRKRRAA